jgi:hypothetical protein
VLVGVGGLTRAKPGNIALVIYKVVLLAKTCLESSEKFLPKSCSTKVMFYHSDVLPKSCSTKVMFYQSHVLPKSCSTKVRLYQSQVLPKPGSTKVRLTP